MLRKLYKCGLILSILLCGLPATAQRTLTRENDGQKRLALIIGNGNYVNARKLVNPPNDAADMTATLTELGFEVISGTNLNLKQMTEKVREFGDKLRASGGVGLFYYAGHGVQVNGRNYLIPVEADIPREDEINSAAFNLDLVLRKMATATNGLNIVILDACRNNPFARSWSRDMSEDGLAQITAPKGTFIAYATSPDMTASDGTGRNGLYTAELLKYIKQPNLKIEETFKEVTKAVDDKSSGKQTPWFSSSLRGEFIFKPNIKLDFLGEGAIEVLFKKEQPYLYKIAIAGISGNLSEIKDKRKVYVSAYFGDRAYSTNTVIKGLNLTDSLVKNMIVDKLIKYGGVEIVETPEIADFVIHYNGQTISEKTNGIMIVVVREPTVSGGSTKARVLWKDEGSQTYDPSLGGPLFNSTGKRHLADSMTRHFIEALKKVRGQI